MTFYLQIAAFSFLCVSSPCEVETEEVRPNVGIGNSCRRSGDGNLDDLDIWAHKEPTEIFFNESERDCEDIVCSFGGVCENGKCRCLKNFVGNHCERRANYCQKYSCAHKTTCVPHLGGFTCVCPLIFTGTKCQMLKPKHLETMQRPDFLYQPLLYINGSAYFLFYTRKVGALPKIQIAFGDGLKTSSRKYQRFQKNPFEFVSRYFYPPLYIDVDSFYAFIFRHSYKKIGCYDIRVEAWNAFYKIFDTKYQVRVVPGNECNFEVSLRHIGGVFHRKDLIVIGSTTKINCPGVELNHEWNLYKMKQNSKEHILKIKTFFGPTLTLMPFTLNFGKYVAVLTTKSTINSAKKTAKVYFEVKRSAIIAEISGGNFINADANTPFYIDGSKSFDPNYRKEKQPPLRHFWYYKLKGSKSYKNINDKKAILSLDEMLTINETYEFKLVVKDPDDGDNFDDFDGVDYQIVRLSTKSAGTLKIVCVRNCFGRKINPNHPTVLSAICIFCPGGYADVNSWSVYYDEGTKLDAHSDDIKFFKNNSTMVIKENFLKPGANLKILLNGNVNGNDTISKSIVYLSTLANPTIGECSVEPKKGYGMLTMFTVRCENTEDNLFYEISHQTGAVDIFSGYSSTGTMKNLTLSPAFESTEYLSVLIIRAFDVKGMYATSKLNVTVLHPLQYYKSARKLSEIFNSFGVSSESNLGLIKASGDHVMLTQQIVSACYSMMTFSNDTVIDFEIINKYYMDYLYGLEMFGVRSIEHLLTAFGCVLKLPHQKHDFTVEFLQKIIRGLQKFFYVNEEAIFVENINDICVLFLKSVSDTLKIVQKEYSDDDQQMNVEMATLVLEIYKLLDIYLTYKATNEDFSSISVKDTTALMKISNVEYLNETFKITQKASVKIAPEEYLFDKDVAWTLKLVVFENVATENNGVLKFPFIFTNVQNALDNRPIKTDILFELKQNMDDLGLKRTNRSIFVDSSVKISEENIQIYRFFVGKGEDVLIKFDSWGDHRLVAVLKKHIKPTMSDFRKKDTTFIINPKKSGFLKGGLSIFARNEESSRSSERIYCYVGVLPHESTVENLNRMTKVAENNKESEKEESQKGNKTNERNITNINMPYAISVQTVECLSLSTSGKWLKNCRATPKSTLSKVVCHCKSTENSASMTAILKSLPVALVKNTKIASYVMPYWHNPLILFLTLFIVIIFVGVFAWSVQKDKEESLKRTVCFLIDNDPNYDYSYLIIVYTGCRFGAGTTSRIVITLEGTLASSVPHLLSDTRRGVLRANNQDFFVLKTAQPLGDIYRVHLWSDYSGDSPGWFCDKVVVHDVQEHQVWFFIIQKWFTPFHDDISLSFTVYNSNTFTTRYILGESIKYELDSGMHCWLGIFFKQPHNNFSRKQRVGVALMHVLLIMCALMMIDNKRPIKVPLSQIDSEGDFSFSPADVKRGFLALLIALPCHLFFIWLFRCIKPPPQNTYSKIEPITNRYNLKRPRKNLHRTEPNGALRKISLMRFSAAVLETNHSEGSSVVTLLKPLTNLESKTAQSQNKHFLNEYAIRGKEIIVDSFCLPTYFLYVAWTILIATTTTCIFVEVFYGFAFGWVSSLHFLASLFCSFLLSFFVVEPIKLIVASYAVFLNNEKELMVEDRSDLVYKLDEEYKVPPTFYSVVEKKLKLWRQNDFYKPIWMGRALKLHRNKMMEKKIKSLATEMVIILISFTVFLTMYKIFFDPLIYSNFKSIQIICDGIKQKKQHKLAFSQIKDEGDFVEYLNNTLLPNLLPHKNQSWQPTIDENNYLIGSVYLRQIRFGNKNFDNKLKRGNSWKYIRDVFAGNNPFIFHKGDKDENRGGYVGVLRANTILEDFYDLSRNNWFDAYASTINVDFVLFNHNLKHMSFTTLTFKRTTEGGLDLNQNTQVIQMHFKTDLSEVLLIVMFVIFIFYLIFYASWKIPQTKHFKLLIAVYVSLTLTSFIVIFVERIKLFKILPFDTKYVNYRHFYDMLFWNNFLIDTLAFKSFFIVINVWLFLRLCKKTRALSAVLTNSIFEGLAFLAYFLWLLISFAMLGFALFHSCNSQFGDFLHSFYTVLFFSVRHYRNSNFNTDFSCLRLLYCCALFVAVFFVFRNVLSVIFQLGFSKTKKISLKRRINPEFCQLYRYSSNLTKNKEFKLLLKRSLVEFKLRAIGCLIVHFLSRDQLQKEDYKKKFMRFFVVHALKCRFCELETKNVGDFDSNARRLENAKKLARIVILQRILSKKFQSVEESENNT